VERGVRLFTTCPHSNDVPASEYARRVAEVARWSEDAGCYGILVYTDNAIADPWLVAQLIVESTSSLTPLVAVQPLYMHPYAAAKMVATFAYVHGRRLDLNMVAGGFRNDLLALDDDTAHDERYDRLVEYARIVQGLLTSAAPWSFEGSYYRVSNARLRPEVGQELLPGFLVSGSSSAGLAAARALGATAVKYPQPVADEPIPASDDTLELGIRVGLIARTTDEEAWAAAEKRFPGDRKGQLTHRLAMGVSDSHWHRQLAVREDGADPSLETYWLWPFQNYKTFCPYLVGSYERVGAELAAYFARGFRTLILDIPESSDDLEHTARALARASRVAA
jgi:alkanesulfonate monooxygenase